MKTLRILGITTAFAVLVGSGLAYYFLSGNFNVAATVPHPKPVEKLLRRTMEASIRKQARTVVKPANLDLHDPALARRAYGHYSAACQTCHAAPGRKADPWVVAYPAAPDLTKAENVDRWSDEELFWIVKHGIKDTGMIALGPTHKDEDIWLVAAMVRQLPTMKPEIYREMGEAARLKGQGMARLDPAPSPEPIKKLPTRKPEVADMLEHKH